MRSGAVMIVALMAACGCGAKRSREAGAAPTLDDARAYERGTAGPRDFRKAAEIYASLCRDGAGDLEACRKLVNAIYRARGVAFDHGRAGRLAAAMCARRDQLGCVVTVLEREHLAMSEAQLTAASAAAQLDKSEARCLNGDAPACEAALVMHGVGAPSAGASTGSRGIALARAACRVSVLDGCTMIPQDPTVGDELIATCEAGEAIACAAIPGRNVAPKILCTAHDYRACAALGCSGDQAAARLATEHGVAISCDR